MAVVNQWERRVLPQGQLATPQGIGIGEAIGAGAQALGQGVSDLALKLGRVDEIQRERQEKRDQQETTKKVLEFAAADDARLVELQNQAPPGADGFVDAVQADFDKRKAAFLKAIPASAQPYAEAEMARVWTSTQGAALKFSATARVALDRKTTGDIIDQGASLLVSDPSKLGFVRDNVLKSINAIEMSPALKAEALANVDIVLGTATLGGMVQRNPRQALASIDAGKWGVVPAEKLLSLRSQAESKIRQQEALARMEQGMRQAAAEGDLLGRLALVVPALQQNGVVPTDSEGQPLVNGPDEILALIPGRRGEALARQFVGAQLEGQDRLSMLGTDINEDFARWQAMAPKPGAPWSVEDQHRYQAFGKNIADKAEALKEDPAALVVGSPAIQQAWAVADSLAQTPGADPQIIAQAKASAVNATIEAQVSLGAAPWNAKPLTKAQALGIVGQLKAPEASADTFKAVAEHVVALGPQAVAQVIEAGAPPVFAAMVAIDDPVTQAEFRQAALLKPAEVSSILQSTGTTRDKVAEAVQARLATLYDTMPPESRGLYQAGFTDAAIYALGRGAASEDEAADAVTRSLLASVQVDGKLRIPASLDLDAVRGGLAVSMDDLLSGKLGIEVIPPPGINGIEALREAARQGGLTWFTDETGNGAVLALSSGRYIQVINRTSRDRATLGRFTVPFTDAARLGVGTPQGFETWDPSGAAPYMPAP